jgi:hypothetical protein
MKIRPVGTELLNTEERHLAKKIVAFRNLRKRLKKRDSDNYSGTITTFISLLEVNLFLARQP